MQRNRSWRRAQRERKIQYIYDWMKNRNWYTWNQSPGSQHVHEKLLESARHRHSSPKVCSNYCCGNPRKFFNAKTISEHRFDIYCEEEFNEFKVRATKSKNKRKW